MLASLSKISGTRHYRANSLLIENGYYKLDTSLTGDDKIELLAELRKIHVVSTAGFTIQRHTLISQLHDSISVVRFMYMLITLPMPTVNHSIDYDVEAGVSVIKITGNLYEILDEYESTLTIPRAVVTGPGITPGGKEDTYTQDGEEFVTLDGSTSTIGSDVVGVNYSWEVFEQPDGSNPPTYGDDPQIVTTSIGFPSNGDWLIAFYIMNGDSEVVAQKIITFTVINRF